jgi:hypothetical protein
MTMTKHDLQYRSGLQIRARAHLRQGSKPFWTQHAVWVGCVSLPWPALRYLAQLVLGLAIVTTSAPVKSEQAITKGAGTQTCAVFVAHYKGSIRSLENFYFSWAQGYMSGLNVAVGSEAGNHKPADLNAIAPATQLRFIRDYCERNPLKRYSTAVEALLANMRAGKSGLKTR